MSGLTPIHLTSSAASHKFSSDMLRSCNQIMKARRSTSVYRSSILLGKIMLQYHVRFASALLLKRSPTHKCAVAERANTCQNIRSFSADPEPWFCNRIHMVRIVTNSSVYQVSRSSNNVRLCWGRKVNTAASPVLPPFCNLCSVPLLPSSRFFAFFRPEPYLDSLPEVSYPSARRAPPQLPFCYNMLRLYRNCKMLLLDHALH